MFSIASRGPPRNAESETNSIQAMQDFLINTSRIPHEYPRACLGDLSVFHYARFWPRTFWAREPNTPELASGIFLFFTTQDFDLALYWRASNTPELASGIFLLFTTQDFDLVLFGRAPNTLELASGIFLLFTTQDFGLVLFERASRIPQSLPRGSFCFSLHKQLRHHFSTLPVNLSGGGTTYEVKNGMHRRAANAKLLKLKVANQNTPPLRTADGYTRSACPQADNRRLISGNKNKESFLFRR